MGFDIKRMDIYRKVPKDLTQPTVTGAVISICCVLFIIFMLATELLYFVSPDVKSELLVANNDPTEKWAIRQYLLIFAESIFLEDQIWMHNCTWNLPLGFLSELMWAFHGWSASFLELTFRYLIYFFSEMLLNVHENIEVQGWSIRMVINFPKSVDPINPGWSRTAWSGHGRKHCENTVRHQSRGMPIWS